MITRTTKRINSRRAAVAIGAIAMALIAAGCEWVPVENAPAGGGDVVTETFQLGPFDLGPGEDAQTNLPAPGPDGDFGLVGMRFRVVDDEGNVQSHMSGVHLHHIVMLNPAERDQLCPSRAQRFAGSGMEQTPVAIPEPYAYMVEDTDQWRAMFHLMNNATSGDTKRLFIEYDVDYQPDATDQNVRGVTPLYMDTDGCGNSQYSVPGNGGPDSVHVNEASWTAPTDGIAVWTGGHLHNGGIRTQLLGPSGSWCDSDATYGPGGDLMAISSCQLHHRIEKGTSYTVRAEYRNDAPVPDAMGLNFTYVWWGTQ